LDASPLPPGKLPAAALERLLGTIALSDPRILVGPRPGEDAAVIEIGGRALVVATDPITFATDRIGWYAVHVNANDVAVMGARPAWFFAVLLLPETKTTEELVRAIFDDIRTTCDSMGICLCGGHTEITVGLDRPIVVGQMMGECAPERLVRKQRLEPGDRIVLTQGVAIEGTAILARERASQLEGRVAEDVIARSRGLLFDPGISVVRAAEVAVQSGDVHAMHDPTEGGLLAGLAEMAAAARCGLRIDRTAIPILAETRAVCAALGVDPLGLIASGSLLIGAAAGSTGAIVKDLERTGIAARVIGEAVPGPEGTRIGSGGNWQEIRPPARDELARLLG